MEVLLGSKRKSNFTAFTKMSFHDDESSEGGVAGKSRLESFLFSKRQLVCQSCSVGAHVGFCCDVPADKPASPCYCGFYFYFFFNDNCNQLSSGFRTVLFQAASCPRKYLSTLSKEMKRRTWSTSLSSEQYVQFVLPSFVLRLECSSQTHFGLWCCDCCRFA